MHRIFRVKAYEMEHGPHFNEEHARKAVMKMENEDGTRGQHWSLEETSALASQYGISLSGKFNRYDWYVALNMVYSQLNIGDKVYIIEVIGTFKKTTEYNEGQVTQVSNVYEEPLPPGQFPMPNQQRKKLVDITIQCNGESKKFTIPENKSTITDSSLGLTISTNKQEIISIVRSQYNTYKQRKEAIAKCDEEMSKCQQLLDKLEVTNDIDKEDSKITELQKEINELKNIIRKANQMVPQPMKEMLPQDMKDAMNKVGQ